MDYLQFLFGGLMAVLGVLILWLVLAIRRSLQARGIRDAARPMPPELLQGDFPVADPFRDPALMGERMQDFGRFNVRYNEVDGVMEELELAKHVEATMARDRRGKRS